MGIAKLGITGILILIGLLLAGFVTGLIDAFIFGFLPADGAFGMLGALLSFVVYAVILAWIVLFLLKKFG